MAVGGLVPVELDRIMVRKVVGERIQAVRINPNLLLIERWDHSDVFYEVRTRLSQQGYDTSVYANPDRRKDFYALIKPICEDDFKVKRHSIGIFPKDRAIMAYHGNIYSVNFNNLRMLMSSGTDVIVVEKEGTVIKMLPFTKSNGIAFIQAEGFVTEYGIALARIAMHGNECHDYTNSRIPKHIGHVGILTDCDASGITIGLQIKDVTRLGLGLNTIKEINDLNPDLNLRIEDLMESALTKKGNPNSHWIGLDDLLNGGGRKKHSKTYSWSFAEMDYYIPYLYQKYGDITFIEWLRDYRIELNTILTVIKAQKFWNWLEWKLKQVWPNRNYNRAVNIHKDPLTPTMEKFIQRLHNTTKPIVEPQYQKVEKQLTKVKGFIDVDRKEGKIKKSMQKFLSKNDQINDIDKDLHQFAVDHNLVPT
jgi:hypothetical protein